MRRSLAPPVLERHPIGAKHGAPIPDVVGMTFLGRVLLRLVFWLGVAAAVAAVAVACLGTALLREGRASAPGRQRSAAPGAQAILR